MRRSKGYKWLESVGDIETDECLPYPYYVGNRGYGTLKFKKNKIGSHRLSLFLHKPEGFFEGAMAAHKCGNRACCNPRHLYWATDAENFHDKKLHGTYPVGEKNPNAKLSAEDVRTIRETYSRGGTTQRKIACEYGVCVATITHVLTGRNWGQ